MPVKELSEYCRALTGGDLGIPSATQRWRPRRAEGKRLRSLHASAIRMASLRPRILADAEVARGLEQQLIDAVVECVSAGAVVSDPQSQRQTQDIMVRFERLLGQQLGRIASMREICAALGASGRLLRSLCAQHLGMSPTAYDRRLWMSSIRRALQRGAPEMRSISEIARHYGFRDPAAWPGITVPRSARYRQRLWGGLGQVERRLRSLQRCHRE